MPFGVECGLELLLLEFVLGFFGGDFAPFGDEFVFGEVEGFLGGFEFGFEVGGSGEGGLALLDLLGQGGFDRVDLLQVVVFGEGFAFAGEQDIQVGIEAIGQL